MSLCIIGLSLSSVLQIVVVVVSISLTLGIRPIRYLPAVSFMFYTLPTDT